MALLVGLNVGPSSRTHPAICPASPNVFATASRSGGTSADTTGTGATSGPGTVTVIRVPTGSVVTGPFVSQRRYRLMSPSAYPALTLTTVHE